MWALPHQSPPPALVRLALVRYGVDTCNSPQIHVATKKQPLIRKATRPVVKPDVEPAPEVSEAQSKRPPSRQGKVNLSFWMDEETRNTLDIVWRKKGIRRTQQGMEEMVAQYLEAHGEG